MEIICEREYEKKTKYLFLTQVEEGKWTKNMVHVKY